MAAKHKPIPALYTVYILRSTIRHASFYIGSTPNPPRRLSQHNGLIPGGAARTSRKDLRPWEMVALVSGFPSMTAALKFEWALNNPHISVHIPTSSRLAVSTRTKSNGQPMRPPKSMASVVSNLHLLLRVPSFVRWPLRVHFFNRQVFAAWEKWCATASEKLRSSLRVVTDFGGERGAALVNGEEGKTAAPRPVDGLPLDYEPIKELVAKGQQIFEFERQGQCVICQEDMQPGEGLQAVCTNGVCDGVGHLSCWSRSMLEEDEPDNILPVQGKCPKCEGVVHWGDMMKELTLRVRGRKEVDKLLTQKRRRAEKNATKS